MVDKLPIATTEAVGIEQAPLEQIRELVDLYFSPWGAAKGAKWEALTNDSFDPEVALDAIQRILERYLR